jgi:hypothetical protein
MPKWYGLQGLIIIIIIIRGRSKFRRFKVASCSVRRRVLAGSCRGDLHNKGMHVYHVCY